MMGKTELSVFYFSAGMNGPVPPQGGMSPAPRPAHQQPPSAHQQQPEHALQLTHSQAPPGTPSDLVNKEKFLQHQVSTRIT